MKKKVVNSRDEIVQTVLSYLSHEETEGFLEIEFQLVDSRNKNLIWPDELDAKFDCDYEEACLIDSNTEYSTNWRIPSYISKFGIEYESLGWPEEFPAVMVYQFEDTFDRCGDVQVRFVTFVTLKDFENV